MSPKDVSPLDPYLAELAGRQHGLVAAWQLAAAGYDHEAIKTRVRRGRLHRVQRGVYAVGHPVLTGEGRWLAAVISLGPAAVLSHGSAAWLWGLTRSGGALIDVTVPGRGGRSRRRDVRVHRAAEVERVVHRGVPVTTVARTLLDLAAVAPLGVVEGAVDAAERNGLFDLHAIERLPLQGHHGTARLRKAIELYDDAPTKEELERRFLRLCHDRGLPRPLSNAVVAGMECDFVWPAHRLVVELDGLKWHAIRRQLVSDREKDAALVLAGYRVHRFVWRQVVHRPDEVDATMRALLARAA
ncbi:MAG TPA: type IV toxin-antitoxin system AbiEi family antitoxin domain-containing protein [Solirubrobacteraceae bacterium]|nr:type IV toxin-antitoxin system AbiEi family antitoxin domain-containing protein [Solirubrobacteraceae bacterium]